MTHLYFGDRALLMEPDETVLQCLERHAIDAPSACRAGSCHTCLMQCTAGVVPAEALRTLTDEQRGLGYFLPCSTRPTEDLSIAVVEASARWQVATLIDREQLSDTVVRLVLYPHEPLAFLAGQFCDLRVGVGGAVRSYSLAAPANEDDTIEFHVRLWPGGRLSPVLSSGVQPGNDIEFQGPKGHCVYLDDEPDGTLLLVGTSTGLAPLWGIVLRALAAGHAGPIALLHASRTPAGLYYEREQDALAAAHENLEVQRCVLDAQGAAHVQVRDVVEAAVARLADPSATTVYLAGGVGVVAELRKAMIMAGVRAPRILADPFVQSSD